MYIPLRVHGHHSLMTGVSSPAELLARATQLGLPAIALCDVDTTAGLVDFLKATKEAGPNAPRPIVGAEISDPQGPGRLVALVEDEQGYRNLLSLVSSRQLGDDPGDPDSELAGPEEFDLVQSAIRYRQGLIYLVDHPRLALALSGRIDKHSLFVAISPASMQKPSTASARRLQASRKQNERRNVHSRAPLPPIERPAPLDQSRSTCSEVEHPKVPPPEPAVPADDLIEVARATGLATVAAADVYFATPAAFEDHRVRAAIKHNALLTDLPESWLAERPAHILMASEMRALYASLPDLRGPFERSADCEPGSIQRSLAIGARCNYTPKLGRVIFPEVDLGPDQTAYSKLVELAFQGSSERYKPLRPEVVRRLDYELTAIDELGFAAYFLLVRQIAVFARERGIPCVGRGSAADSLVSYCLGLTDADPLRYRLPFERFLNPSRKDRPDIDLDFCWKRRDEVLEHVYEAFGPERTAMIATLGTFGLRSAYREVALAEGVPPAEVTRWSTRLPWITNNKSELADEQDSEELEADAAQGAQVEAGQAPHWQQRVPLDGRAPLPRHLRLNPIARAFHATPECRDFPFDDPRQVRILERAANLMDTPRYLGLHPGGVVVAPHSITDYASCQRAAKGVVMTQLDKNGVEAVGLVKMDLLGNRALTVIDECLQLLARDGIRPELETIDEAEARTAELLREGRTLGCFQVESPGMRNLLQQTGARNMDDVIQAVALIRPGPAGSGMKDAYVRRFRGLEQPTPPHPRLTELLWETHGVMLYQEDVMQVASLMAGMDLSEADLLRRSLQKRRTSELEPLSRRFREGCKKNGVEASDAARIWELICNFASFGFCKAHAVTYGRIAYRAVYLKAHHPAAFMTAFLRAQTGYYKTRVYVEEARRLGVPILPPDINRSGEGFELEQHRGVACLRIGLGQVKGLSERALQQLLESREREGPYLSLPDFLERSGAHINEAENLIRCGAFEDFDRTRPELLWRLHLLRSPNRRAPRTRPGETPLDPAQLDACRSTPHSRNIERIRRAHQSTGGWSSSGLGLGSVELEAGASAPLFPDPPSLAPALPGLPETSPTQRGADEYELLGMTIGSHPVNLFLCEGESEYSRARNAPPLLRCSQIIKRHLKNRAASEVTLHGWLAASRRVRTSDGKWMRFLTLEDESGLAEVVLFSDAYRSFGYKLTGSGPFMISGTIEDQLGSRTLHATRIW